MYDRRWLTILPAALAVTAAVVLSGCAGSSTPIPSTIQANSVARTVPYVRVGKYGKARVRLTIRIPRKHHGGKRLRFVSPSTASMTVNVTGTGGTATPSGYPKTVDLTIGSTGCTSSLASTTCTLALTLPAGHYLATVTTYDQTGGTGNILSAAQAVPFTVLAGQANTIPLTLGAYPASIVATPIDPGYLQSSVGGLKLYGAAQQRLLVEAEDADGNTIVGAGAPRIGASAATPSQLFVTPPPANALNTVYLQAATAPRQVTPGFVTLNLSATPPNDAGASVLNASVSVQILHSVLFYTYCAALPCTKSNGSINAYFDGDTVDDVGFLEPQVLSGIAADNNGTLWVTTNGTSVIPFDITANGYGQESGYPIMNGLDGAASLAVDASSTLFVSNTGNASVAQYPIGWVIPLTTYSIGSSSLAVDAQDTLYAGFGTNVKEYLAGSSTVNATIPVTGGAPLGVAVDNQGTLYVVNATGINVYSGTTLVTTLSNGINQPAAIAVDAARTVYVANTDGGNLSNVIAYPAGSTNSTQPATVFSLGAGYITALSVVPRPL